MIGRNGTIAVRLLVVLAVLAALLGACQPQDNVGPSGEPTSTPPGGPPAGMPRSGANVVPVTLTEYEIDMDASISGGATAFEVTNEGATFHNFRVQGEATDVSLPSDLAPGETVVLEVVLEPGDYVVTCPIANHADLGMRRDLTVVSQS